MAGKIPPQFLANIKKKQGATKPGGPTPPSSAKKQSLPPWLAKKGSVDQTPPADDSKNPFAAVTKGKSSKKMSPAEKKALLAKARKMAVANKFNKDGVDAKDIAAAAKNDKKAI